MAAKLKVMLWVVLLGLAIYPTGLSAMSMLLSVAGSLLGIRDQYVGPIWIGGVALYRLAFFFGTGFVVGRKLTHRDFTFPVIVGAVLALILMGAETFLTVWVSVLRGTRFGLSLFKPNLVWVVPGFVLQAGLAALGGWVAQRKKTG